MAQDDMTVSASVLCQPEGAQRDSCCGKAVGKAFLGTAIGAEEGGQGTRGVSASLALLCYHLYIPLGGPGAPAALDLSALLDISVFVFPRGSACSVTSESKVSLSLSVMLMCFLGVHTSAIRAWGMLKIAA